MLNAHYECKCNKTVSCDECMKDAPYHWCCKLECGEHEFCKECEWFENNTKSKIYNKKGENIC